MGEISLWGADHVGQVLFGKTATPLTNYYVALITGADVNGYTTGAELDEPTDPSYTRMTIANGSANWLIRDYGRMVNVNELLWPAATVQWGRVRWWAICDTSGTGTGNVAWFGKFGYPRMIDAGDQFRIYAEGLKVQVMASTG